MPNPGDLSLNAVPSPEPELRTGEILDDAISEGHLVRCTEPALDPMLASDPMPWMPYAGEDGRYFPKRGDRALVARPPDGPPAIVAWWPSAGATPDAPY